MDAQTEPHANASECVKFLRPCCSPSLDLHQSSQRQLCRYVGLGKNGLSAKVLLVRTWGSVRENSSKSRYEVIYI